MRFKTLTTTTISALTALALSAFIISCSGYFDDAPSLPDEEPYYEESDEGGIEGDYSLFEDLGYYGRWYEVYPYGWVWRPTVVPEWRPYAHGHWIQCADGYLWASYEPYGWIVYHYGFWAFDRMQGWIWIPDWEWTPSRVNWFVTDEYVYWSPMWPPTYPVLDPWEYPDYWIAIEYEYFDYGDVGRYDKPRRFKESNRDRTAKRRAPEASDIAFKMRRRMTTVEYTLVDSNETGKGRTLSRVVLPPEEIQRVNYYRSQQPATDDPESKSRTSGGRSTYHPPAGTGSSNPAPPPDAATQSTSAPRSDKKKSDSGSDGRGGDKKEKPKDPPPEEKPKEKPPERKEPENKSKEKPEKKDDGG